MILLLVEDNLGDVGLIREALASRCPQVELIVARDGLEGLELLTKRNGGVRPDLVLLDLNLPRMDGRELLEHIKSDSELRRMPVIILTSSNAPQDVVRAYDLHANCYLVKPPDFVGIENVVGRICDFWLETARLPGR